MYSEVFCKVYNVFGWNYYPEIFGQQLLVWLERKKMRPKSALDLACGTGVLCRILKNAGMDTWGMDFSAGMIDIARSESDDIHYDVADMTVYRPEKQFDLVTCTGDAVNHIGYLADVRAIFRNVFSYLSSGGWFVFDLLNSSEVSDSEPFEMDFEEDMHIWFQMTRPEPDKVNLKIRVYEKGSFVFEENIRETIHDVAVICRMLEEEGFHAVSCRDRLLMDSNPGTTWFITARKD